MGKVPVKGKGGLRLNHFPGMVGRGFLATLIMAGAAIYASGPRPSGQRSWSQSYLERQKPNEIKLSPFPRGPGLDDTANLQAWLNEAAGGRAMFQSVGGVPYRVEGTLKVPLESWIESTNPASCEIEKVGNGDLFQMGGATFVRGLYVRAATPQASGAAFDFSHQNANNCTFEHIKLGNNFFNGFFCVCESGLTSFGVLKFHDIEFQEPGTLVKKYGNAGFEFGSKTKRTIGVWMSDIYIGVATPADMPKAINVLNTDSFHVTQVLVQNAGIGLRTGEGDNSALTTTNTYITDFQCDGCTTGFFLENLNERHSFVGCTAEACATGVAMLQGVGGTKWIGCTFSANEIHGAHFFGSVGPKRTNSFTGCDFSSNGKAGGEGNGVLMDESSGGLQFTGCSFTNAELSGSKTQKVGFTVGKKSENVTIVGCRFSAQGVGINFETKGETVNCPTTEAELKEKFGCIFA